MYIYTHTYICMHIYIYVYIYTIYAYLYVTQELLRSQGSANPTQISNSIPDVEQNLTSMYEYV